MRAAEHALADCVAPLAVFYQNTGRQSEATEWLEPLTRCRMANVKGRGWLSLGQLAEQSRDYAKAAGHYEHAIAVLPSDPRLRYLMHNNLGYSLNEMGSHKEAETNCRIAIEVAPDRYNAHKNLGVALEGQGRWVEAAESYLKSATSRNRDVRPLMHLDRLVEEHPEVHETLPELADQMEVCRTEDEAARARTH